MSTPEQRLIGKLDAAIDEFNAAMWRKLDALERAAWSRSWKELKAVRKELEAEFGPRPKFQPLSEPEGPRG